MISGDRDADAQIRRYRIGKFEVLYRQISIDLVELARSDRDGRVCCAWNAILAIQSKDVCQEGRFAGRRKNLVLYGF